LPHPDFPPHDILPDIRPAATTATPTFHRNALT
jgi:hypothetical protein